MSDLIQRPALGIDPGRYATRIRDALLIAVYERFPVIILIEAVLSTALINGILFGIVSPAGLVAWLGVHFVVTALHLFAYLRFRRRDVYSMEHLDLLLNLGMIALGVFWALLLGYSVASIQDYTLQLYFYTLAQVFGLLAMFVLNERQLAFYAFAVPQSLSLAIIGLMIGREFNYAVAIDLLCTIALVLLGRAKHRHLVESLAMRFAMKDLTEELAKQRDVAERANVAKSKFLAAASHDLRQPLHALALLTAAMESRIGDSEARGMLKEVQSSVGSLEKMFNALLDISRLDAGVMCERPEHFDLAVSLRRICAEYVREAEGRGLRLVCEPGSFVAHTDPILLERILRNFLSNAVRYTDRGEIHVRCLQGEDGLRIEVADTGMGIPQSQQQAIFDEFFQLENPERDRNKGLGIGLAIVRRIAELLGLPIGVQSVPREGSCFFVVVPEGNRTHIAPEAVPVASAADLAGLRVLVIDDDSSIRESMLRLLATWNCECVVVESEVEAVAAAKARFAAIDAIVADYRLREHRTGLQAVARLRQEFDADIPALLVSGDTAPERLRDVAESGYMLVHKPVQLPVLKVFLANALRAKSAAAPTC